MLIVGGRLEQKDLDGIPKQSTKVEIISPGTGRKIDHCLIKSLPDGRSGHTINWPLGTEQLATVCGGGPWTPNTLSSCIEVKTDGSWVTSHSLENKRLRK